MSFYIKLWRRNKYYRSIGVASYPETTNDVSVLIEEADKALYQAKRSGRNRVCMNYEVNQLPILTSV
nr:diguanylate cyclase [Niallia taxi]